VRAAAGPSAPGSAPRDTPLPHPSHAKLPASPLWTFGKQLPTPGGGALTVPEGKSPPGARPRPSHPRGPQASKLWGAAGVEKFARGLGRAWGRGTLAFRSYPEPVSGGLGLGQRSGEWGAGTWTLGPQGATGAALGIGWRWRGLGIQGFQRPQEWARSPPRPPTPGRSRRFCCGW
jgi:hypothetical protein